MSFKNSYTEFMWYNYNIKIRKAS